MKMLQATLDMAENRLHLKRLGVTVPVREAAGSGHFEVDLLGRAFEDQPPADTSVHDSKLKIEKLDGHFQ